MATNGLRGSFRKIRQLCLDVIAHAIEHIGQRPQQGLVVHACHSAKMPRRFASNLELSVVRVEELKLIIVVLAFDRVMAFTEDGLQGRIIGRFKVIIIDLVRFWIGPHHHEIEVERRREEYAKAFQLRDPSVVVAEDQSITTPLGDSFDLGLCQVVFRDLGRPRRTKVALRRT